MYLRERRNKVIHRMVPFHAKKKDILNFLNVVQLSLQGFYVLETFII